eukprot:5600512-Alexandrium_andersonii.AAC.1
MAQDAGLLRVGSVPHIAPGGGAGHLSELVPALKTGDPEGTQVSICRLLNRLHEHVADAAR